jgi:hypothetical protein
MSSDRYRYLKDILPCAHDAWWTALGRVMDRVPHPPRECISIASSSPVALWYCSICHQTYPALRNRPYICEGGYPLPYHKEDTTWSSRWSNLATLQRVMRYSKETGTEEAVAYHETFLSEHTQYK